MMQALDTGDGAFAKRVQAGELRSGAADRALAQWGPGDQADPAG